MNFVKICLKTFFLIILQNFVFWLLFFTFKSQNLKQYQKITSKLLMIIYTKNKTGIKMRKFFLCLSLCLCAFTCVYTNAYAAENEDGATQDKVQVNNTQKAKTCLWQLHTNKNSAIHWYNWSCAILSNLCNAVYVFRLDLQWVDQAYLSGHDICVWSTYWYCWFC